MAEVLQDFSRNKKRNKKKGIVIWFLLKDKKKREHLHVFYVRRKSPVFLLARSVFQREITSVTGTEL